MTPAARLQAAIEILDALAHTDQPADRLLKDWFRARRYAGSKDRAAVAERVFAVLRHRSSFAWRVNDPSPRGLVVASVLADKEDPSAFFSGTAYGPAALSDSERKAIASHPADAPMHVRGEYPQFLEPELGRAFDTHLLEEMLALQSRAPVDLRVNTLKSDRQTLVDELNRQGFDARSTPWSPFGVRVSARSAALGRSALFETGAFEFQDEAAQIVSILCAPSVGGRVLDAAAGAGGKALALAALMQNTGEISATDVRPLALEALVRRAARAGVSIIKTGQVAEGLFDVVLVDAPCSGTGTWRRQPELRWRLTTDILANRMQTQDALLDSAAKKVRVGGRLVYATCSILPCENQDRVEAFLARHRDFVVRSAAEIWRDVAQSALPPGMGEMFRASALSTGSDGFFAAILVHSPALSSMLDKKER